VRSPDLSDFHRATASGLLFDDMTITIARDELNRIVADYFRSKHPTIQDPDAFTFVNPDGEPECTIAFNPFFPAVSATVHEG
jgi:hypothetical protein